MPTRTNTFEDWLFNGGPMPGFELPEVPLPDSVTLCRICGEIMKDPAAAIHDEH